jgi:hypothetical protein
MMKIVAAMIRIIRRSMMGDARGCWVCFSWYWVFCVVVVSWVDVCDLAVFSDWLVVDSSSIIRVPPPCSISWLVRSRRGLVVLGI